MQLCMYWNVSIPYFLYTVYGTSYPLQHCPYDWLSTKVNRTLNLQKRQAVSVLYIICTVACAYSYRLVRYMATLIY